MRTRLSGSRVWTRVHQTEQNVSAMGQFLGIVFYMWAMEILPYAYVDVCNCVSIIQYCKEKWGYWCVLRRLSAHISIPALTCHIVKWQSSKFVILLDYRRVKSTPQLCVLLSLFFYLSALLLFFHSFMWIFK